MAEVRKKFTPHTEETISKILELHDEGMRSKDISSQSKELFGFKLQQSSISKILVRNGRDAKSNTFRVKRGWRTGKRATEALMKKRLIPYISTASPNDDHIIS